MILRDDPTVESIHRAFEHGGRKAVLHWYIDEYKSESQKGFVSPYQFAVLFAQLGDKPQILAYLGESLHQHTRQSLISRATLPLTHSALIPITAIVQMIGSTPPISKFRSFSSRHPAFRTHALSFQNPLRASTGVRTHSPGQAWVPFRRFCSVAEGVGHDGTPSRQSMYFTQRSN
jgi:hypothetical protein